MKVAVLGLGEAGSLFGSDLARAGDDVHGFDPAPVPTPDGVRRHQEPELAVDSCELVLALTAGSDARQALESVIGALDDGAVYADLSTCSPGLKRELSEATVSSRALFADVALMSPVPERGLAVPSLVSGNGAERYAGLVNARGGNAEIVGPEAGEAATRKLLRSVVMKGLAAILIESSEAAEIAGKGDWFWDHMVEQMTALDQAMLRRLVLDTSPHAVRRVDEMEAALALLAELGVKPTMTTATIDSLRRVARHGLPEMTIE